MKSQPRILASSRDIRQGVMALRRRCAVLRRIHDLTGDPPLRRQEPGFAGLARIIVAQQVSAASADAIWRRTLQTLGAVTPAKLNAADDETFRACGLSRPKVRTLRALAATVRDGTLDLKALDHAPDADVHAALTAVSGIGPWTADIYLMFSLGRADAWAQGDLALQLSLARAFDLPDRPGPAEMLQIAEAWRPWRAIAARLIWSYHRIPSHPQPQPSKKSRTIPKS